MSQISSLAVVLTRRLGSNVRIDPFAVIRSDVTIGDDVLIHPHVVIEDGVTIGDGVEVFPGAYLGKPPKGAGALSRTPRAEGVVEIGPGCSIGPHAVIFTDVRIGASTLLGDGASIREQSRIGSRCMIGRYVTINYNTQIGDRVRVQDHSWLAGNMTIEDDVFISGGVGTSNDNAIGRHGYLEDETRGPFIARGAAIGLGANLLPGIRIGVRAVVGAGSVVTRSVADDALVMGVPARERVR
ncbi:DapH/DapD/GlmU-related protein [Alsobacter sp. KACC 23698]|uniref:DapH/DapD/GlmU-related protein n=1 Tax=Alsobacter sp. KACC 23698 TaxID=3149229 RepID=A0AAU7JJI7_9HYPH